MMPGALMINDVGNRNHVNTLRTQTSQQIKYYEKQ
jgi:hypothetical protein